MIDLNDNYRNYCKIFIPISIVFCLCMAIYNFFFSTLYYVLLSLTAILLLFVPSLIYKLLELKKIYAISFLYYIFLVLAFVIGMMFNGYARIPFWDKFVHMVSGLVFTLLGSCLYYVLKTDRIVEASDYKLLSFFSVCFSITVAAVWEIYEYILNLLLHTDPQRALTTGVNDTMLDIIVCLIGSLAAIYFLRRFFIQKRPNFYSDILNIFCNLNPQK